MNRNACLFLMFLAATVTAGCQPTNSVASPRGASVTAPGDHRVAISVDGQGFHPSTVTTPAGRPVTLVFTRTTDQTCATEVVFPTLNLRRPLPLNQPVAVTFTPAAGTVAFTCGMNMFHGSVVAQ